MRDPGVPHPAGPNRHLPGATTRLRRAVVLVVATAVLGSLLALAPRPVYAEVPDLTLEHHDLELESVADSAPAPYAPWTTDRATGVDPFAMIGVELDHAPTAAVEVRWERDGQWGPWTDLEFDPEDGPDKVDPHAPAVSEPIWVEEATGYELRIPAPATDGRVLLVHEQGTRRVPVLQEDPAGAAPSAPPINRRSSWGAAPPREAPRYADRIDFAVIHHTATGNDYRSDQVPAILRAIQTYHMHGNGWNDIAYHFFVDRYGRIWEGRAGGIDRAVIGGHARGFNTRSFGVAMLGNFVSEEPTDAAVRSTGRIVGWKLLIHGRDATSTFAYRTAGNERYAAGTTVHIPRVVGHLDIGYTACPGLRLYRRLDEIRNIATRVIHDGARPFGSVDLARPRAPDAVTLYGWAADADAPEPINVHVYIDGVGYASVRADAPRRDVARHFPWLRHPTGFQVPISGLDDRARDVCVYGINQGMGSNRLLGCTTIRAPSGSPFGGHDPPEAVGPATFRLRGWAIDPDTTDPVNVHLYVDGVGYASIRADHPSATAAALHPGWGSEHGFELIAAIPNGARVCAYAIDRVAPGGPTLLGCHRARSRTGSPFGSLDAARLVEPRRVEMAGWAIDPDTTDPVRVHLHDRTPGDERGLLALWADQPRSDVERAYPGWGPDRGFRATVSVEPGTRRLCAYLLNGAGSGGTRGLPCADVHVPGGRPFGSLDLVTTEDGELRAAGWAIDPDTAEPIRVHLYTNGRGAAALTADRERSDVARVFPLYGSAHGFDHRFELPPAAAREDGTVEVCAFAIDAVGDDGNRLLGCPSVQLTP